jgi:hypothetical protein
MGCFTTRAFQDVGCLLSFRQKGSYGLGHTTHASFRKPFVVLKGGTGTMPILCLGWQVCTRMRKTSKTPELRTEADPTKLDCICFRFELAEKSHQLFILQLFFCNFHVMSVWPYLRSPYATIFQIMVLVYKSLQTNTWLQTFSTEPFSPCL